MTYLVTGAAGFIGFHTSMRLLERGEQVLGIDSINDYYDPALKHARLAELTKHAGFTLAQVNIADMAALTAAAAPHKIRRIIHLAAQAGVRYSIENPHAYVESNLTGHVNMLELARHTDTVDGMSYASSSSVYGGNKEQPFSEDQRVDQPMSLYAATKKADELMSHVYAHLYRLPLTGLRFFTVYGPWGRPDMAMWLFTKAILAGEPIKVFNNGDMRRDFTYIDDIVTGVIATADNPPSDPAPAEGVPHKVYNIGNNNPEQLMGMIGVLEQALGKEAIKEFLPLQPGDVPETSANIDAISNDHGFVPKTTIAEGIPKFIEWYKAYHKLS